MFRSLFFTYIVLFAINLSAAAEKEFHIVIQRKSTSNGLLTGKISVNGKALGTCYENDAKKIPAGKYKGVLRHSSMRGHVQGPGGKMGNEGDFLVEVADVPGRTDILLHAGNKVEHSVGCILLGPVTKDENGAKIAPAALKELRLQFFDGMDDPTASPNKVIIVEVRDPK